MKSEHPKTISVYFEEKLLKLAKKKAKDQDMSVSQYFRRLVRKDSEASVQGKDSKA
jgi:hypothetical protein